MRYSFGTKLTALKDHEDFHEGEDRIEVLTLEEFKQASFILPHKKILVHSMENPHYCKAEIFGPYVIGTLNMPNKKALMGEKFSFGYYLQQKHLILIDNAGQIGTIFSRMKEYEYAEATSLSNFFAAFLDFLIRDDVLFLQQYEQKLSDIETELLDKLPPNFYQTVISCRKELLVLHSYYEQLVNLGEELKTNSNHLFTAEECDSFGHFANRTNRLHDHVEMLREYVLQIREMYQSQIDISQNRNMNFLTLVTTIFLPLTLLVGWYGMNFVHMPELHWKYGYGLIILLSIAIVTGEILLFKKKKLL